VLSVATILINLGSSVSTVAIKLAMPPRRVKKRGCYQHLSASRLRIRTFSLCEKITRHSKGSQSGVRVSQMGGKNRARPQLHDPIGCRTKDRKIQGTTAPHSHSQ
jgi:hypothetical protein